MRSKEVEKAIKLLKTYENKLVYEIGNKDKIAVEKVLNYISELEKNNMGLLTRLRADSLIDRDNYWKDKIRDKIKELEKLNFNNYANEYDDGNEVKNYILKKFKELLGE